MDLDKFVDSDLEQILEKRVGIVKARTIVVASGITSSHLGDERNLREFLFADLVTNHLRKKAVNVVFFLFDDNYDPLSFNQLKVAVRKDEKLIRKFEHYCGTPIKLIPDPYGCHDNYSAHYQEEILNRFHKLNIFPNIIDSWSLYESGVYDFAKEIVFTRMEEIRTFLKKEFPKYTVEKIFWPLCQQCHKMDKTTIDKIVNKQVAYSCTRCKKHHIVSWKKIKGKFSWKIDIAIKWNVFKSDFEPFSKAYLDPDVGSYFIAKSLSKEFFGGHFPEVIQYGQILMDRNLSYTLLASLPNGVLDTLFLSRRKSDIKLSGQKVIQLSNQYIVRKNISFYDYVQTRLPYESLEFFGSGKSLPELDDTMKYGGEFMRHILKKEILPKLPTTQLLNRLNIKDLIKIGELLDWVISYKSTNPSVALETFTKDFKDLLGNEEINIAKLFPIVRRLLSQEKGIAINKVFYYMTNQFLNTSRYLLEKQINKN